MKETGEEEREKVQSTVYTLFMGRGGFNEAKGVKDQMPLEGKVR